jgi:hypothetical protein
MNRWALTFAGVLTVVVGVSGQVAPPGATAASAIDRLGSFDFQTRTDAARAVRRGDPGSMVPALLKAAHDHADEYTRFRALVLAAGFAESTDAAGPLAASVGAAMRQLMSDRNDRVRTVVYQWFEYHPASAVLPALIAALDTERSEFVRPALTRSIAAQGPDPRVAAVLLPLMFRGDDFFRGAIITALGEHRARYAVKPLSEIAMLDGPLQDDAVTALGRIGDPSARTVLATLQGSGARELQPTISAALCLIGIDCEERMAFITESLQFAAARDEYQPLLRGAVHAAGVLALAGQPRMLQQMFDTGIAARDPARAAVALGIGTVALRRPVAVLDLLQDRADRLPVLALLQEAFDMLAEEYLEERFFVQVRRAHWDAPADSARRQAAAALIETTEF